MLFDQELPKNSKQVAKWEQLESVCGLTQRVAGITQFTWKYASYSFQGSGTKRKPYELFDEVLCALLLIQPGLDGSNIRSILGLEDELGKKAFSKMITPLQGNMISGDESMFLLTPKGEIYAKEGYRYENYRKAFSLNVDLQHPESPQVGALLKKWTSAKVLPENGVEALSFPQVLAFTEQQFPQIHLPEKGFFLDSANVTDTKVMGVEISIGILEDFETKEAVLWVFTPQTAVLNKPWTQLLNNPQLEAVRNQIIEKYLHENEASISEAPKPPAQIEVESELIEISTQLAQHPKASRAEKAMEIKTMVQAERRNFDTLQFERELERIAKHCTSECWLISPWVRQAAFEERKGQIEQMLRQGASVFIGFSAPHRPGEEMISASILQQFVRWENQHAGFFFAELSAFHEKIVIAELEEGEKFEYTGSFNILSFSAIGKTTQLSRENMRRLSWQEDSEKNYRYFKDQYQVKLNSKFMDWAKDLKNGPRLIDPIKIDERAKELQFFEQKFHRLGIEKAGVPSGPNLHKLLDSFRIAWTIKELDKLNKTSEKQLRTAPSKFKNPTPAVKKILNRFPGLPATHFADALQLTTTWEPLANLLTQAEKLGNKLRNLKEPLTHDQKQSFEKELESLASKDPKSTSWITEKISSIRLLIKEKSPLPGLTIKGKVDLPKVNKKNKKK